MECKSCGAQIDDTVNVCPYCTAAVSRPVSAPPVAGQPVYPVGQPPSAANKVSAGLCAIFLGALGIHKFILGYKRAGIIMLCITVLTCGYGGIVMWIIGLVEGITYLTRSDEVFVQTYVINKKEWF